MNFMIGFFTPNKYFARLSHEMCYNNTGLLKIKWKNIAYSYNFSFPQRNGNNKIWEAFWWCLQIINFRWINLMGHIRTRVVAYPFTVIGILWMHRWQISYFTRTEENITELTQEKISLLSEWQRALENVLVRFM